LIILAAGLLPLRNFVGRSHWDTIQWTIPPAYWHTLRFYFDVVVNIALFYPLGMLLARVIRPCGVRNVSLILGGGLLLSVGIEVFQIFCDNRYTSLHDIVTDVTGTALGMRTTAVVFSIPLLDILVPSSYSQPTGS